MLCLDWGGCVPPRIFSVENGFCHILYWPDLASYEESSGREPLSSV